jgi:hypothetical protein
VAAYFLAALKIQSTSDEKITILQLVTVLVYLLSATAYFVPRLMAYRSCDEKHDTQFEG